MSVRQTTKAFKAFVSQPYVALLNVLRNERIYDIFACGALATLHKIRPSVRRAMG
ncbi:hypothetical protein [Paraburkholderia humisilvae]|uniref:hypothetical protein n=1 Tax=Paraburkholderia humisilvae TaxID=627669 RepID=UPI00158145A2|nr:hypothetical protein [Paraburkholderia humisilvae]